MILFVNIFSLLSPLEKGHGLSFEQTLFAISQVCSVPSLVEIGPVVFKKKIFRVGQCIFAISLLSPLGNGRDPSFKKLESPSPKKALCQFWLKLALWFLRRRPCKFVYVFSLFRYYLPLEKGGALHMNNLNPHHPRMLCAKFV